MNQCKYCGGMGCQACRYGEGFESVDLIASYLEAQSPQAAANKAAEEGEMTFFLSDIYEICDEYAKFFASKERDDMSSAVYQVKSRFQHLASKKDAIAADRASRQVANKAAEEGGLPFADLSINQKRALSEGLSALEAMADIWSAEIQLSEMAQRIADAPAEQRPGTIAAMIEQAFIEGAYRHFLDHKDEEDRASRPAVVPRGFKLVPEQASTEMKIAGIERYEFANRIGMPEYSAEDAIEMAWDAMLSVAQLPEKESK